MARASTALAAVILPALVAGCSRPPQYVALAPEGAVECALEQAIDLGYRRMAGGSAESVVRVSQRPDPRPGEGTAEPGPAARIGERLQPLDEDRAEENQLLFRHERGRLHIQVVSLAEGSPTRATAPAADAHARQILAACSTP